MFSIEKLQQLQNWLIGPVWEHFARLGIVVLVTFAVVLLVYILISLLIRRSQPNSWHHVLAKCGRLPLFVLIAGNGLGAIVSESMVSSYPRLQSALDTFSSLLGVVTLCWFLLRIINNIWAGLNQPDRNISLPVPDLVWNLEIHTRLVTYMIARVLVWAMLALMVLQSLGVNLSGILAIGGIGGIIIGFAAKEMLTDTFSSLTLLWSNEFKVGDWIKVRGADIEGTVESITWRKTCIRSLNKRMIHAPNSLLANSVIENISHMTHRRINETIGLRYCDIDKVSSVIGDIKKMLTEHPGIDEKSTFLVWFNSYGSSSVDIRVICMTKATEGLEAFENKQDVLLKIAQIIQSNGADFAFPTRTVQMVQA